MSATQPGLAWPSTSNSRWKVVCRPPVMGSTAARVTAARTFDPTGTGDG